MDIAFSEGERERDRERTEREGRRETGIYSVTFTLISGKWSGYLNPSARDAGLINITQQKLNISGNILSGFLGEICVNSNDRCVMLTVSRLFSVLMLG